MFTKNITKHDMIWFVKSILKPAGLSIFFIGKDGLDAASGENLIIHLADSEVYFGKPLIDICSCPKHILENPRISRLFRALFCRFFIEIDGRFLVAPDRTAFDYVFHLFPANSVNELKMKIELNGGKFDYELKNKFKPSENKTMTVKI